jgi:hypothetical protein
VITMLPRWPPWCLLEAACRHGMGARLFCMRPNTPQMFTSSNHVTRSLDTPGPGLCQNECVTRSVVLTQVGEGLVRCIARVTHAKPTKSVVNMWYIVLLQGAA